MSPPDLRTQARDFAGDITRLVNATVANGVTLSAVVTPSGTTVVGRGVTKNDWSPRTVPLTTSAASPRAWLRIAYILTLDPDGQWLTVTKSDFSICLDDSGDQVLAHYDFDRSPSNEYPSAHLQVNGESPHVYELCHRAGISQKELGHLHFPVGGKRFRPTLEDVIEMLIVEELVSGRPGWEVAVAEHRDEWERRQLAAAVRRNPEVALQQLQEDGHL